MSLLLFSIDNRNASTFRGDRESYRPGRAKGSLDLGLGWMRIAWQKVGLGTPRVLQRDRTVTSARFTRSSFFLRSFFQIISMKTCFLPGLFLLFVQLCCPALGAGADSTSVVSRERNRTVWLAPGASAHQYTEIANGLNYFDPVTSTWEPAREEFTITSDGYALANHGQHQVRISPMLNDAAGTVLLRTPEGREMRGTILGLAVFDRVSGRSLLIANVTGATGRLVAPNIVLFTNCFEGVLADVRFVYQKSGFHQDVLLRERISPERLKAAGFTSDLSALRLEIWTEWFAAPDPTISGKVLSKETNSVLRNQMAEPDVVEESLDFGDMKMPTGKAYLQTGVGGLNQEVTVSKRWLKIGARTFLVESVAFDSLEPLLSQLPPARLLASAQNAPSLYSDRRPPGPHLGNKKEQRILFAHEDSKPTRLALDYVVINTDTNALTCSANATYYVTGPVNVSQLILQENAVIKFAPGAGAMLNASTVTFPTNAFKPVIFTAKDDDSVGEVISGSTGSPSGFYADTALKISGDGDTLVQNTRLAYATTALHFTGSTNGSAEKEFIRNVQVQNCQTAIYTEDIVGTPGAIILATNALVANSGTAFSGNSWSGNFNNVTIDSCFNLLHDDASAGLVAGFTNSIFTSVTNNTGDCMMTVTGSYNGFYNDGGGSCGGSLSPTFGAFPVTNTVSPFQTFSGNAYYLAAGSSFVNAGTGTADQFGLYHFTTQTNQTPEGSSTVDLGFHYLALDASGNSLDADGDGSADYIEDSNGNGVFDGGDTSDWTDYYNGTLPVVLITDGNNQVGVPANLLALPLTVTVMTSGGGLLTNAPITFVVTNSGATMATATNGTFSSSISLRTSTAGQAAVYALMPSNYTMTINITATAWSGTQSNQVLFTATTIGMPRVWLRADAGVTTTNGAFNVRTWADQTTNHFDAIQPGPTGYALLTNALNGKPVVRFVSGVSFMYWADFLTGTTQAEAIVVLKAETNKPAITHQLWIQGGSSQGFGAVSYPETNGVITEDFGSKSNAYYVGIPAQPINQIHMYQVAAQTGSWQAWINGELQVSYTGTVYGEYTTTNYYLGSHYWYGFAGDIAEVMVFNKVLTTDERDGIGSYLNQKYCWLTNTPPVPIGLQAQAIATNEVSLSWSNGPDNNATVYKIERKTGSGNYCQIVSVRDSTSYLDTNVVAGTTYTYRVKAWNYAGESVYSAEVTVTTPADGIGLPISNLRVWLKADAGVVRQNTNNGVGIWFDQSPNHFDATQSIPGDQPLLVTNALNGKPVVRFDAITTFMNWQDFLTGTTQAEVFVVLKAATNRPSGTRQLWIQGGSSQGYGSVSYPETNGTIHEDFGSKSNAYNVGLPTQPLTQFHTYEVSAQTGNWTAWINGELQATYSSTVYGEYYTSNFYLGSHYYYGFAGDLAEILVFNRTLTSDERDAVGVYLNEKYSLVATTPDAPVGLSAQALSTNEVSLSWTNTFGNNTTVYKIERKTASGNYSQIATVRDGTSYFDTNVIAGTTYTYRVKAWNYAGDSAYSSEVTITTPTDGIGLPIGNLRVWLKADVGVVRQNTNNGVGTWFDQSPNHFDASQLVPGSQALLVTNVLNGKPVVRFISGASFMNWQDFVTGTTQIEAFVVLKAETNRPPIHHQLWIQGGSSVGYDTNASSYPDVDGTVRDDFGSKSNAYSLGIPTQPLNQFHLYQVAAQTGSWKAWINGAQQASYTGTVYGEFTTTYYFLGSHYYYGFAGDIAEIMIFNRVLTGAERDVVNAYLNSKYSLMTVAPSGPTNLTATAISPTQINLSWSNTTTVPAGVQIERKTESTGTYAVVGYAGIGATSYSDTGLASGHVYYYRIRASNVAGDSPYSNEASALVNTPPSISITNPTNGAVFISPATLSLVASASDSDGSVVKVEFFSNSTNKLAELTNAPYSFTWSNVLSGSYSFTAKATDNLGGVTVSSPVNVIVSNIPPTIALTAPTNTATYGALATIQLSATASDTNGSVVQVDFFYASTNKIGTATSSPYAFTWTNVNTGSYPLTAVATDNEGGSSTSSVVNVTVTNTPPTVALTIPTNNAAFATGRTITLVATASDPNGSITNVQFFYAVTNKIGQALTSPYTINWTNVPTGTYSLTAKAFDNEGAARTSSPVTITVSVPPTVSITSPTNNTKFITPANVAITASASGTNGISKVDFLYNSTNLIGTKTSSPYTITWSNVTSVGTFPLTAIATDGKGLMTTSSVVNVIISNTPPTVSLTNPVNNALFTAPTNITLSATASDTNGSVARVDFFYGSTNLIGTCLTSPYTLVWTSPPPASYSLTAKATDNLGATTTSSAVNVIVSNRPPTVSITSPTNNALFRTPTNISITASATASYGSITNVEFFYSSTNKIGQATNPPYSIVWSNPVAGSYSLTARATDNFGTTNTSSAVNITVSNPPPVVTLTNPTNNSSFTAPVSIPLSATASDPNGSVSKVEFFYASNKIGEVTTPPYNLTWSNVLVGGTYALTARATDNEGATTVSSAVTVTVSNPPPTVSLVAPTNNALFQAPATIPLLANASDTNGYVAKVEFFYTGTNKIGEVTASPFGIVWTNVAAGVYSLTAKATDDGGVATTSGAVSITVNAQPTVSITNPVNNATFTAPTNITIGATASDSDGTISKVDFYYGANLIGTKTSSPYSIVLSNAPVGTYPLTAIATDNQGGVTTSAAATISVITNFGDMADSYVNDGSSANSNFGTAATLLVETNGTAGNNRDAYFKFNLGNIGFVSSAQLKFYAALSGNGSLNFSVYGTGTNWTETGITWSNRPALGVVVASTNIGSKTLAWYSVDVTSYIQSQQAAGSNIISLAFHSTGATTVNLNVNSKEASANQPQLQIATTNSPPTVTLTFPAGGAVFIPPTNLTLTATASDSDGIIKRVEFFQGSSSLGVVTSTPYAITWSNVLSGVYSLTARATDNFGAVRTSSPPATITVDLPPSVSLTCPTNNSGFIEPALISLAASAADSDGTVTNVSFFQGGNNKLADVAGSPYNFTWTNVPQGGYSLTARAADNVGLMSTSGVVNVTVYPAATNSLTNPMRLASWRFETTNWLGDQGQVPISFSNIVNVADGSNNVLWLDSTNPANLKYRDVETNHAANIDVHNGSVVFWFKPDWASVGAGGTGPGTLGQLISLGQWTSNANYGCWNLTIAADGSSLSFITQTNGAGTTNLVAPIAWVSNVWHQVALTYSSNGCSLYIDAQLVANGSGVVSYPDPVVRATDGINIGSDRSGNQQARGRFDDLETFNYVLTVSDIASRSDSDGDGLPDRWEIQYGLNPNDPTGNNGADGDLDGDGLTNIEEWLLGTNPTVNDLPNGGSGAILIHTPLE